MRLVDNFERKIRYELQFVWCFYRKKLISESNLHKYNDLKTKLFLINFNYFDKLQATLYKNSIQNANEYLKIILNLFKR